MIPERTAEGCFFPGKNCGQAGEKPPLAGRRVLTQDKSDRLGLKLKVLVVADTAAWRKMIRNYLKQKGLKNTAPLTKTLCPRLFIGRKNKAAFPANWKGYEYGQR